MEENISSRNIIKNFLISLFLGIIIPSIIFTVIDPKEILFNRTLIISNGILYIISYTSFGIFKKHTFTRFIVGLAYLFIQLYFYLVGSNVFTLYLPHSSFGVFLFDAHLLGIDLIVHFDYSLVIYCILALKVLNLIRNYNKVPKEEDEFQIIKFKKNKEKN